MPAAFQRRPSSAIRAARLLALITAFLAFLAPSALCEHGPAPVVTEKTAGHDAHAAHGKGLPNDAPVLFHIGPLPVNNSMIITWIVAIGIIVFAQRATRRIRSSREAANEVPSGAQNFWEFLVESLYNFLGEILGPKLVKKTFWFFATIFIFILFTNWFGLLPGVGTIGWSVPEDPGSPHIFNHVTRPLFRGGNADLNMTAAMALTFFGWWTWWAIRENSHGKKGIGGFFAGIVGVLKHLFAPKGKESGFMKYFLILVFAAVGLIEVVSILFRPVSLSFRLYGNVFAGENILESMMQLVPWLGWLIPVPFYFLELLVGLVQALVFTLLTSVFTLLICEHEEEHQEGVAAHH